MTINGVEGRVTSGLALEDNLERWGWRRDLGSTSYRSANMYCPDLPTALTKSPSQDSIDIMPGGLCISGGSGTSMRDREANPAIVGG